MINRRQFLISAATALAGLSGCTALKPSRPHIVAEPAPEQDPGPRPFRVALLSDPHTVAADSSLAGAINAKLAEAVADYQPLKPDLWLVNGDIADRGRSAEIAAFQKIMARVAKPDQLLVNTGNHDFYDPDASDEEELRRFREAFSLPTPYSSRVAGGIHFVLLADEQYKSAPRFPEWAWLTADQLRWFERVLEEHREVETVVALHQPLQDTVVWSHGNNSFAGCGQGEEIRAILARNPQVKLWLSGHTHMGAEVPGNLVQQNGVTFVGLGSTFYHFVQSKAPEAAQFGGFVKDLKASQSRLLDVWPDRLVLRARDHARQAWMDEHEMVLPRT